MAAAFLPLCCRVVHIAATCTSLGGLFYARMVLWPTVNLMPEVDKEQVLAQAIRRFAVIKWTGVIAIAITGIIQWLWIYPSIRNKSQYLLYFTIKMVGAVSLFSITFLLAAPIARLREMQNRRAFWSGINVVCGLLILIGAALMHAAVRR